MIQLYSYLDLLKRLSKTQKTVFSGRILTFLAQLFPLNEKSGERDEKETTTTTSKWSLIKILNRLGLNQIGHFNTENVTKLAKTKSIPTPVEETEVRRKSLKFCFENFKRLILILEREKNGGR